MSYSKEKYTKVKFEDSLRRYQPPLRKRVKMESSRVDVKATEISINNRLIRLCETRKLYQATSRERASQFSRKKQAHQESTKKLENIISSLDEGNDAHIIAPHIVSIQKSESMMKESMNQDIQSDKAKESYIMGSQIDNLKLLNFSGKFSGGLDSQNKQQQNQSNFKINSKSPIGRSNSLQKCSIIDENNQSEIRDVLMEIKGNNVLFHTLIQQAHLEIVEQYQNVEQNDISVLQNLDQGNINQDQQRNQLDVNQSKEQSHVEPLIVNDITKMKWLQRNLQIIEKLKQEQMQEQASQKQNAQRFNTFVEDDKQTFNKSSQMIQVFDALTGRFKIESSKGTCLYSARIFNRLCQKELTNDIANKILKHHPYLSQSRDQLQTMVKNFIE